MPEEDASPFSKSGMKKPSQSFFSRFNPDVIDGFSFVKLGIDWNLLKYDVRVRKVVFGMSWVILAVWMIAGWDSSASQIEFFLLAVPKYLMGQMTRDQLFFEYSDQYGKGMHYSAFVIYGLMFWYLSRYFDKTLDIHKSRNFAMSLGLTLFSIGVFEFFWQGCFSYFQNQPWVLLWKMPQLKILLQNLGFLTAGSFMLIILHLGDGRLVYLGNWHHVMTYARITTYFPKLKLNWGKTTLFLLLLTFVSVALWIDYGLLFPVETLAVQVEGYGLWISSKLFPQTVYTIETNILDNIVAGEQFFLENNLLHGVNTLSKVLMTLFFTSLFRLKKSGVIGMNKVIN